MSWQVQLAGDLAALRFLSEAFAEGPVVVVQQDDQFFLVSEEFGELQSAGLVRESARDIVESMSGAACLGVSAGPIKIGTVDRLREDGGRDIHAVVHETMRLRDWVRASPEPSVLPQWVDLARRNDSVAKALRLRGRGDLLSWVELYRLWEVVEEALGGSVSMLKTISEKQRIRFKRTANSVSAAGDQARHGSESTLPPPNPMDPGEARGFVDAVLREWLQTLSRESV